jgi:ribonuclease HII
MLMAGVLIEEKNQKKLKKIGCKDSKQLTRREREELFDQIKEISLGYHIIATSPTEIDGRASVGLNLNNLEAIKTAAIINALIEQFEEKLKNEEINVIVDCPSPNTESWKTYLKTHIKFNDINLRCEHKADINHVECSAASILAKVTRDNEIDKIKKEIGHDIGSGYPSDPVTVEFLEKHSKEFKNHGIFRKTWGTWTEHVRKKEQKKLDGF